MDSQNFIDIICKGQTDEKVKGFVDFLSENLWKQYDNYLMDKSLILENEIKFEAVYLPNAKEGEAYDSTISFKRNNIEIKSVSGLPFETIGLTCVKEGNSVRIFGKPNLDSLRVNGFLTQTQFNIEIEYIGKDFPMPDSKPSLKRDVQFIINQDPRKLWKDIPVDWENMSEPKYRNDDTQIDYVKVETINAKAQKDIVGASKRGRSHAQEGKPRDDHFQLYHDDTTNWYVMVVADGAGSAPYSREGSRLACDVVINHCKQELSNCESFEDNINLWHLDQKSEDAGKLISADIYRIVGNAAYKAHKAINEEAAHMQKKPKEYATTLLVSICKKFEFGWFIASFWVGDGAICLYDREKHTATLLGTPDEGEYAGQTRFLTMPEIFSDKDFYKRLSCRIVPDFTALFLMTDGVSDPKFETDSNLLNPNKWDELWNDITSNPDSPVHLEDDNDCSKFELLNWLDFWAPGHHDDRTIAIMY